MELRSAEHNIRDMLALYRALRKSTAVDPKLAGLPEVISAMEVAVPDVSSNMQSLQQVVETLDQIKCKTRDLEPSMNKFRKRLSEVRSLPMVVLVLHRYPSLHAVHDEQCLPAYLPFTVAAAFRLTKNAFSFTPTD
jgi:hypothetical protein